MILTKKWKIFKRIIKIYKFKKKFNKKQLIVINRIAHLLKTKKFINNYNNRQILHKKIKLESSIIFEKKNKNCQNKFKKNQK